MIMHELKTWPKTSVCYARRYPPCGHDMCVDKVIGDTAFTGQKVMWINCMTCFPLLNVGFLTILKRTDCFVLIWACIAVLAVHHNCHFQNCLPLQKRNPQKRKCSSVLPCCSSKRCLLSCMVGLIRLQTSTRVIWFQGYGPCGCQGRRGARVSVRFIASQV